MRVYSLHAGSVSEASIFHDQFAHPGLRIRNLLPTEPRLDPLRLLRGMFGDPQVLLAPRGERGVSLCPPGRRKG